jgi:CRP-like cAMP-binding protein
MTNRVERKAPRADWQRLQDIDDFADIDERDARVVQSDDLQSHMVLVQTGAVDVSVVADDGRRLTYVELGPGDVVGLEGLAEGEDVRLEACATAGRTEIWLMPRTAYVQLLSNYSGLQPSTLRRACGYLRAAERTVRDVTFLTVRERAARRIAHFARRSSDFVVRESHERIADWIGVDRQHATRALSWLCRRGLLRRVPHEHAIAVPDIDALTEFCEIDADVPNGTDT